MISLPNPVKSLCQLLIKHNFKPIVVGGYVRDFFLDKESKDIDIEVYNVHSLENLKILLSKQYKVSEVGKSFGVLKVSLDAYEIDISLPRTETKTGLKHNQFEIKTYQNISFKEAALRRDFSINSMGYDVASNTLLDPYNGYNDIQTSTLRHVSKETFVEDPLRVFRAIQFCARFEFTCTAQLEELLRYMYKEKQLDYLPKERLYEEMKKLLLKSATPSIGFNLIKKIGLLDFFPQIGALVGVIQDEHYHAEGDVYIHTMMVLDEMAHILSTQEMSEKDKLTLMYAALCHDFGKPISTEIIDKRIRAIRHEITGIEPTTLFLQNLCDDKKLIDDVANFVKHHLKVMQFFKANSKSSAIRRLSCEINIEKLVLLAQADYQGRISSEKKEGFEAGIWLLAQAKALHVESQKPPMLIQGRDLITLGLTPSKEFSTLLNKIYEAQLDGHFNTYQEALEYLHKNYNSL